MLAGSVCDEAAQQIAHARILLVWDVCGIYTDFMLLAVHIFVRKCVTGDYLRRLGIVVVILRLIRLPPLASPSMLPHADTIRLHLWSEYRSVAMVGDHQVGMPRRNMALILQQALLVLKVAYIIKHRHIMHPTILAIPKCVDSFLNVWVLFSSFELII